MTILSWMIREELVLVTMMEGGKKTAACMTLILSLLLMLVALVKMMVTPGLIPQMRMVIGLLSFI